MTTTEQGNTPTPRTDAVAREHIFISDNGNKTEKAQNVDAEFARTLEREAADLRQRLDLQEQVSAALGRQVADKDADRKFFRDKCDQLEQQLAAAEARTVELCAAQRALVPILPGDMPDEMWAAIANDRDAYSESLRIVVRQTLDEYEAAIRALTPASANETADGQASPSVASGDSPKGASEPARSAAPTGSTADETVTHSPHRLQSSAAPQEKDHD